MNFVYDIESMWQERKLLHNPSFKYFQFNKQRETFTLTHSICENNSAIVFLVWKLIQVARIGIEIEEEKKVFKIEIRNAFFVEVGRGKN
jgi:hypothetical protein